RNSALYNDEVKARLKAGDTLGALEILDLAEKNCAANDYTQAIRASILQQSDPTQAAALRMKHINAGSRNSALYNDEVKARLKAGDTLGALEILDLAEKNGASDEYTHRLRNSVLKPTNPA
ncbi:hypothetical protein, partial [Aeromonas veronii]|uniref:hypothetical protein n=1 Tax=Aeromonas veronii TaxID=654 RepID=UPI002B46DBD5